MTDTESGREPEQPEQAAQPEAVAPAEQAAQPEQAAPAAQPEAVAQPEQGAPTAAAEAAAWPPPTAPVQPTGTVYTPGQAPQPYHAPQYSHQPHAQQAPTAPQPASATQPTVPLAPAAAAPGLAAGGTVPPAFGGPGAPQPIGPAAEAPKKSSKLGLGIAAGLVVGALIGGGAGAGISALVLANSGKPVQASAGSPQNIVVNDTGDVSTVTAVAAKASPSVVTISVAGNQGAGTGSGVILSDDGYVLTNTHVVTLDGSTGDPSIQVKTSDGKLYAAELIGTDPMSDLAVVKLQDASGLTPLEFADSDALNVGDTAIAIGAPLGLAGTVTNGIVSALNRSIDVASSAAPETEAPEEQSPEPGEGDSPFDFWNFPGEGGQSQQQPQTSNGGRISLPVIQTDAAINPGNSGGALLDAEGKLIGINVAILSTGGAQSEAGNIGVGFAVPSNLAQRIANEIIEHGEASHGLLGATVGAAAAVDGATTTGAVVNEVTPGGAAEQAGLRAGDVVTSFNGLPITDQTDLTAQVRALAAGSKAEVGFVRGGEAQTVEVTLGALEG